MQWRQTMSANEEQKCPSGHNCSECGGKCGEERMKLHDNLLGVKHIYKEGEMDQVDRVLWDLKNNPFSRRIMTDILMNGR